MNFQEEITNFASKIESLKDHIHTEEATKTSIILPLFHLLGYDIFNPAEFCPEYIADVGIKKGEKVDYAILNNGSPMILIEVKCINQKLDKHDSQLFRYFATTNAKFAILTNGILYRFYTDLKEPNKMDKDPFLQFDFSDLNSDKITALEQFTKKNFNVKNIIESASLMQYASYFKNIFAEQLSNPSDDFVKFFLKGVFPGTKTQAVVEKFRPILKDSLNQYIDSLSSRESLNAPQNAVAFLEQEEIYHPDLTSSQTEFYRIIKEILSKDAGENDITFKITETYLAILYQSNSRKWICRYLENSSQTLLILPDENKKELRYRIQNLEDIQNYAKNISEVFYRYQSPTSNEVVNDTVRYLYTKWGKVPYPHENHSVHLNYDYYKELVQSSK